ncbi:inositol-trisphosphate 3-kinase A-like [Aphis craccivora]|uniref:Inositol-trisphosphate 3-kinase A-like n=1 Tax=Aphis craccivora TaxID=307492 RepID=A0A6G0ZAE9_APHCR|nr:inositol-trisphosphate 3-kinase A-like [Aphis craccivora]
MSSPSTDEFRRRRGRRTGAAAVAAAYSGDQRQATPPFPSVCRLVEKYTMLIERHRQNQQNGSKAPAVRGKPSPPSSSSSSSTTVPPQPKQLSSSTVSDEDAAAWNHLLMDGGGGRKNKNDRVDGNGRRDVDTYGCYDDDYDYDDDDDDGCGRRFSSVSLSSIQPGTCARAIAATAAAVAITARRSRRRDGEEISCRLPRAPGYRRARAFIIIILLRNDGPCVSDDGRFLFHFPFCRLFCSLGSLN